MFEPSTVTIAEAVNNHHLPYSKARLLGAQTLGLGPPDIAFLYRKMWTMQAGRILVYDRYVGHTLTEGCGSIRTTKCHIFALPDKCAARQCSCVFASLDFKSDHVRLLTWIDREAWATLFTIHTWNRAHPSKHETSTQCWTTVYDAGPALGRCVVSAGIYLDIYTPQEEETQLPGYSKIQHTNKSADANDNPRH